MGKIGLKALNLFIVVCLTYGCSSSIKPTYLKDDVEEAIQNICKNEYKIDVKAKLVGQTLWIYLPLEDTVTLEEKPSKSQKPQELFSVEKNEAEFEEGLFKIEYAVRGIPEKEGGAGGYRYKKEVIEKINNVWKTLRRVLFSMDRSEGNEPKFFSLVIADIKHGFETKELFYYLDVKKVTYEYISWGEYQHRSINTTDISPEIIGNMEGTHLDYKDITLDEFISLQIQHRIKLKFQKPEVDKNVDIDKEILKIAIYTIKTYEFKDFTALELENILSQQRTILNRTAVWTRPME